MNPPRIAAVAASVAAIALGLHCGGDPPNETTSQPRYTTNGVYRCCLPDAGTDCCDDSVAGKCFPYGGMAGRCFGVGEDYDGKDICAQCCPGLVPKSEFAPGDAGPTAPVGGLDPSCRMPGPPSLFICLACGDGQCGAGENYCNCPLDCPPP